MFVEIIKYANTSEKELKETAAGCLLELGQLGTINLEALKEKIIESENTDEAEGEAEEIDIPKEKIQTVLDIIQKWKSLTHSPSNENSELNSKISTIQNTLNLILKGTISEIDTKDTVEQTKSIEKLSHLRLYKIPSERNSIINALLENKICDAFKKLWSLKDKEEFLLERESSNLTRIYLNLVKTLWSSTDRSDEICRTVLESGTVELFMRDLSSPTFLEKIQFDPQKCIIAHCIRGYLGICLNIIQRNELNQKCRAVLREKNSIEILNEYIKTRYNLAFNL